MSSDKPRDRMEERKQFLKDFKNGIQASIDLGNQRVTVDRSEMHQLLDALHWIKPSQPQQSTEREKQKFEASEAWAKKTGCDNHGPTAVNYRAGWDEADRTSQCSCMSDGLADIIREALSWAECNEHHKENKFAKAEVNFELYLKSCLNSTQQERGMGHLQKAQVIHEVAQDFLQHKQDHPFDSMLRDFSMEQVVKWAAHQALTILTCAKEKE